MIVVIFTPNDGMLQFYRETKRCLGIVLVEEWAGVPSGSDGSIHPRSRHRRVEIAGFFSVKTVNKRRLSW